MIGCCPDDNVGQDPDTGKLATRVFLIAFQRVRHAELTVLATRLARSDLLNEDIAHLGDGPRACPPAVTMPGAWFGRDLFG